MKNRYFSYAKVNIILEVISKRDDGYHNIKSIFARIDLKDILFFEKRDSKINIYLKNNVNAYDIPVKSNLIYKATELFLSSFNIRSGVDIYLEKNIPLGAGLGGGSSNAATTLIALSEMFNIEDRSKIVEIGKKLGSDIPFFLANSSFAICSGRGEIVEPLKIYSKLPYILLIFPDLSVLTKDVYSNLSYDYNPNIALIDDFINDAKNNREIDLTRYLFNRLESSTFKIKPEIEVLKKELKKEFDGVCMSGSGSTVFVIDNNIERLKKLRDRYLKKYSFVFLTKFV